MYQIEEEIRDLLDGNVSTTYETVTYSPKKYYVGNIRTEKLAHAYLPAIMVYGTEENMTASGLTTARDRYEYLVRVKLVIGVLDHVASAGVESDKILEAQRILRLLMAEKDANGVATSGSVLGILRRNIVGTNYLYHKDIQITYDEENIEGTMYYQAIMTLQAQKLRNRS